EKRMLNAIEKATRQKIEMMELPSTELINDQRIAKFKQRITDTLANEDLGLFTQLIEQYQHEHNVPAQEIAAALAQLAQGKTPLLLQNKPQRKADKSWNKEEGPRNNRPDRKPVRKEHIRKVDSRSQGKDNRPRDSKPKDSRPKEGMVRYRIEVGHNHDVKPGNIVGAIANEAGIDGQHIGHIDIQDNYSLVDLPEGMPKEIFKDLKKVWVSGQQLKISRLTKEKKGAKSDGHTKTKEKARTTLKIRTKDKGKPKKSGKKKKKRD
ncbi:MAG: DbpA RNA binding domain-containing protein, partial [Gammaproteobacteria bacterium]|nr:DbpA RNA binding domain-containing protein [Gammaproteobacteria bacterium]